MTEKVLDTEHKKCTIVYGMYTLEKMSILFPRTRWMVLRELVLSEPEGIHVRELARRTGLNAGGVGRELKKLEEAEVVESKKTGGSIFYRLNPACQIYDEIRRIIVKTVGAADEVFRHLKPLRVKIRFAYIYGSFASGTHDSESDIDLMIVGDVSLESISEALGDIEIHLRREVNPSIYSYKEYKKKLEQGNSFISQVHKGPKIMIIGEIDES